MKLRGIEFGSVFASAGSVGIFSEREYPQHRIFKRLHKFGILPGYSLDGITRVTKTITQSPNAGELKVGPDGLRVARLKQRCIWIDFRKGIILNAVGLTNLGAKAVLRKGIWQNWEGPFVISFAPIGDTETDRKTNTLQFVNLLLEELSNFKAFQEGGKMALELDLLCPNVGSTKNLVSDQNDFLKEASAHLSLVSKLGIPIIVKINVLIFPEVALKILNHDACDAIAVSNAVPFGAVPDLIPWEKYFGSADPKYSPLAEFGGGALSGRPVFPLLHNWIKEAEKCDFPYDSIIAGGGIFNRDNVRSLSCHRPRVGALSFGSVLSLRPNRIKDMVQETRLCFK